MNMALQLINNNTLSLLFNIMEWGWKAFKDDGNNSCKNNQPLNTAINDLNINLN